MSDLWGRIAATLWPYGVVLLVGAIPNGAFRMLAVLLARGVSERAPIFEWIRVCAVTLLAAVVSKIVTAPPAALAALPIWVPVVAIGTGVAVFAARRNLFLSLLGGEAVFVLAAALSGR